MSATRHIINDFGIPAKLLLEGQYLSAGSMLSLDQGTAVGDVSGSNIRLQLSFWAEDNSFICAFENPVATANEVLNSKFKQPSLDIAINDFSGKYISLEGIKIPAIGDTRASLAKACPNSAIKYFSDFNYNYTHPNLAFSGTTITSPNADFKRYDVGTQLSIAGTTGGLNDITCTILTLDTTGGTHTMTVDQALTTQATETNVNIDRISKYNAFSGALGVSATKVSLDVAWDSVTLDAAILMDQTVLNRGAKAAQYSGGFSSYGGASINGSYYPVSSANIISIDSDGYGVYVPADLLTIATTYKIYKDNIDVSLAEFDFSIQGATTPVNVHTIDGLTLTIDSSGAISIDDVTDGSWSASSETVFTLIATNKFDAAVVLTQDITVRKSKQGLVETGVLTSDSQSFKFDQDGNLDPASPSTITFSFFAGDIPNNGDSSVVWSVESGTATLIETGGLTATLPIANLATNSATIRASLTAPDLNVYFDEITVFKLYDGETALTSYLTNEAHVEATDVNGDVIDTNYTGSSGDMVVFRGSTELATPDISFDFDTTIETVGITDQTTHWRLTKDGIALDINKTTGVYAINSGASGTWTSDTTTFALRTLYSATSVTVTKIFTMSKATTGATGATGDPGTNGTRGSGWFYGSTTETTVPIAGNWAAGPDAEADAAVTAIHVGGPIEGDVVTLTNLTPDPDVVFSGIYDGVNWSNFDQVIDGNLLVEGTVASAAIKATAIDGKTITGANIRTAATGQRVELSDQVGELLSVYDTDGTTKLMHIDSLGSLQLSGNLAANSVDLGQLTQEVRDAIDGGLSTGGGTTTGGTEEALSGALSTAATALTNIVAFTKTNVLEIGGNITFPNDGSNLTLTLNFNDNFSIIDGNSTHPEVGVVNPSWDLEIRTKSTPGVLATDTLLYSNTINGTVENLLIEPEVPLYRHTKSISLALNSSVLEPFVTEAVQYFAVFATWNAGTNTSPEITEFTVSAPLTGTGTVSGTLAGLSDTNITSVTLNDILQWDGTDWINTLPNYVTTDSSQTITGTKTFSNDVSVGNTAGNLNLLLDNIGNVDIKNNSTAGGWARGLRYRTTLDVVEAGAGFLGSAEAVNSYHIGFGASWWATDAALTLTPSGDLSIKGALFTEAASGNSGLYLDSTASWVSGVLNAPAIRWREADGTNIAGIRGYVDASDGKHLQLGTGWLDAEIDISATGVDIAGTLTVGGVSDFTGLLDANGGLRTNEVRALTGQQLVLNAGESHTVATGQGGENVYINAEAGLQVISSPDNWATGWAGRQTAEINKADGTSSLPGTLSVSGFPGITYGAQGTGGILTTPTGTLTFGSLNTSWCHFQTDRANFHFNKGMTLAGAGTATDWTATSDISLKNNIKPLKDGLSTVLALEPVTHEWISDDMPEGRYNGLIAQQVEKIDASLVTTNEEGIKSVNYMKAVPVLISAIQELKTDKDSMSKDIESLKSKVDKLMESIGG